MTGKKPRPQCAKCPWKKKVNPRDIPGEYCEKKHENLRSTIAEPGTMPTGPARVMACHEAARGEELPCVGYLVHQLNEGNNLGLRMAVVAGRINANVRTVGVQHKCFEDTLPRKKKV